MLKFSKLVEFAIAKNPVKTDPVYLSPIGKYELLKNFRYQKVVIFFAGRVTLAISFQPRELVLRSKESQLIPIPACSFRIRYLSNFLSYKLTKKNLKIKKSVFSP